MSTDLSIWSEMMKCLISRLEFLITQKSNSTLLTFATMIVSGNHFFPSVTHMQKLFSYTQCVTRFFPSVPLTRWHTVWHSFYLFKKPSQSLNKLESLARMRMQLTERLPNMPRRSAGYIAFQEQPGMPLLFDEDGIDQPFPMPVGKPSYIQGSRSSKTIH